MVQGQLAGRDWTNGRTLEDQLVQKKLWAEESVDLVLESRRQLFGVAPCVSWATTPSNDAAAWLSMEGFAVVACGESFVLPGGQTSRSVDAAAQGAAHGIGYNSRATIVLLVTTTGMFCDKALWSIVSRHRGPSLFFQKSTFWVPPRFTNLDPTQHHQSRYPKRQSLEHS